MKKEIKRVKRERVYQGTIVDVYKDYMEFSNGNHEVWDKIAGCFSFGNGVLML